LRNSRCGLSQFARAGEAQDSAPIIMHPRPAFSSNSASGLLNHPLPHLVVGEGRVRVLVRFKQIIPLRLLGSSCPSGTGNKCQAPELMRTAPAAPPLHLAYSALPN